MTTGKPGSYPWFPFYPADFLTDEHVVMMSAAEVGVYIQLLCHAWKEGSVPDQRRQLARLARVTEAELDAMWPALAPCFVDAGDGRLVNPRLAQERAKLDTKSDKARRSAEARWDPNARAKRKRRATQVRHGEEVMRSHSEGNARAHANASANGVRNGATEHAKGANGASAGAVQVPEQLDVMRTHSERNANAMLLESESEEKKEPKGSSKRKTGKGRKPAARKAPLPADWKPNDRHAVVADEELVDLKREAERMRNWALSKGEKRLDWDATFTNWLRSAYERGGYASAARTSRTTGAARTPEWSEETDRVGWAPLPKRGD